MNNLTERKITDIFARADIELNGTRPWDIQINNDRVYNRIIRGGDLAAGESFLDGDWSCIDWKTALSKMLTSGIDKEFFSPHFIWLGLKSKIYNLQSKERAFEVGEKHYDFGNEMYGQMLGKSMVYTCADFRGLTSTELDQAQLQKLDLICKKLDLQPGKRLLDIGCGWGSLMKYAAEKYGVECVGLSVSKEQTEWARNSFGSLPCSIQLIDYRDLVDTQGFDYITSIEMIEAVGPKNFKEFFKKVASVLRPDGNFLLQAIMSAYKDPRPDPWINKYIFPNGVYPAHHQLVSATEGLLTWENMEDIGRSYPATLDSWWQNIKNGFEVLQLSNPEKYNARFLRMMQYYLQACSAMAEIRGFYDWQIVFTKKNF